MLAVYRVAGEAIARARDGGGPTLLECRTYRTRAHAEGMGDFTYRTKEDVAEMMEDFLAQLELAERLEANRTGGEL